MRPLRQASRAARRRAERARGLAADLGIRGQHRLARQVAQRWRHVRRRAAARGATVPACGPSGCGRIPSRRGLPANGRRPRRDGRPAPAPARRRQGRAPSSPSSSLTAMRSAWKARVAGSLSSLAEGPTARRTISASSPVVSMRLSRRRSTMAWATRRLLPAPRRSARRCRRARSRRCLVHQIGDVNDMNDAKFGISITVDNTAINVKDRSFSEGVKLLLHLIQRV